jgi:hypothetical protein
MPSDDHANKTSAKEYTVKRIEEDVFELWYEDTQLVTLTKDEAWPVMLGQIHPEEVVPDNKVALIFNALREDD